MRVQVVGVGNIGTAYGWALAQAGHDVTHLVRGTSSRPSVARLDVLDERSGKAVRTRTEYGWTLESAPRHDADLVLVATPAREVRTVVAQVAPAAPDATILSWALEWDPVHLSDLADPERLLMGYPDSGGTRDQQATYVLSLGREPHLGMRAGTSNTERLAEVTSAFDLAGFRAVAEEPFEPWLWVHCANTIPYWLALAHHGDVGRLVADRPLVRRAFGASREVVAVARTFGQVLSGSSELATMRVPTHMFPFIFRMLYRTNEGMRRAAAHGVEGIDEGLDLAAQVQESARLAGVRTPLFDVLADEARGMRAARVASA